VQPAATGAGPVQPASSATLAMAARSSSPSATEGTDHVGRQHAARPFTDGRGVRCRALHRVNPRIGLRIGLQIGLRENDFHALAGFTRSLDSSRTTG
jgi:hypothetical protein